MQETLQALLGLQDIDRHIFRVENELRRLPRELQERQKLIDEMAAQLEEQKKATQELRANIGEIEDVTTQQRQRQRKLEAEATKAAHDAAMLAHFDHEIRNLKRTIGQAEDDGLKLVEKAEQLEAYGEELRARYEEELRVFEEFRGNVEKETAAAESELAKLKTDLEARTSTGIRKDHLELYRRLLVTREGEAMAELDGRICQGCFVEIPKNLSVRLAQGLNLVQCPSCDRILFTRF